MTRSRPANKNDSPHVEQKNWTVARHAAGYWRYDTTKELAVLNRIWPPQSPLTNLFPPQQKLIARPGRAKVIKTYDKPRTPDRRLLTHPDLVDVDARAMTQLLRPEPGRRRRHRGLCRTLLNAGPPGTVTTRATPPIYLEKQNPSTPHQAGKFR